MRYLSIKEQLRAEQRKNEFLEAENARLRADIEYLAMMTDVELEEPETEEHENDEV